MISQKSCELILLELNCGIPSTARQLPLNKKQTRSNYILTNNFNSINIKKKVKILKDKLSPWINNL